MIGKSLLLYLDDMIVVSKTVEEHLAKLEIVFKRLKEANLLINPDKSRFMQDRIRFLGHTVDKHGSTPNDDKVRALKVFPRPKNAKDIKSFLGMMTFYRHYIPAFSVVAAPLTALLRKDVAFTWNADQETAFIKLRSALITEPVLIYPSHRCV